MITYTSDFDSNDVDVWSGLGYYYQKMLRNEGFKFETINHLKTSLPVSLQLQYQLYKYFLKKKYDVRCDMEVAKKYADIIQGFTSANDYIFTPNAVALAYLRNDLKKILYIDATFNNLINFYPSYSNLSKSSIRNGHLIEQMAFAKADVLIFTSGWAAKSAINDYDADPSKILLAPYGANFECLPALKQIEAGLLERHESKTLQLLFIGNNMQRKGGDIALRIVKQLNQLGCFTTLHIIGDTRNVLQRSLDNVVHHGFLSKKNTNQLSLLKSLFLQSHFLILPTRADCTPVVFSEANAFGLPCLSSDVGGIPDIIEDDKNGKLFNLTTFEKDCVNYILDIRRQKTKYNNLCLSAYSKYITELNWKSTGQKISDRIKKL